MSFAVLRSGRVHGVVGAGGSGGRRPDAVGVCEVARARIEAHGGVVEKFIGDAVVGVFGVPAAHEDDPERAVRAGCGSWRARRSLEAIGGAPLRLRVGINTGEALVRLGASAGLG